MNNQWETFLLSIDAELEDNTVKSFGHPFAEEQDAYSNLVLADLSHYSVIEASGDDVVEFMQGQFTHDIKLVTNNISQLSAYCNPKGRILVNFRIFKRGSLYFLRFPSALTEITLKRLRMFVMRSKVELVDKSDDIIRIGIAGSKATESLSSLFKNIPENTDDSTTENEVTIIRLPGSLPSYEVYGDIEKIKEIWEKLQPNALPIGQNSWNLLTIRAAIPEIVAGTVEAFVPQMVNLQAINSLSFTKGCYPGQEVVARMHYLGKLKRRLFIASVESDALPTPGQPIMSGNEKEQKVGQIVTASWSKDKKVEVLAVLQIEKAEKETLHIGSSTGPIIKLIDLPYSIEIEEKE